MVAGLVTLGEDVAAEDKVGCVDMHLSKEGCHDIALVYNDIDVAMLTNGAANPYNRYVCERRVGKRL